MLFPLIAGIVGRIVIGVALLRLPLSFPLIAGIVGRIVIGVALLRLPTLQRMRIMISSVAL